MSDHKRPFQYVLEIHKRDPAEHLGTVPVVPDWEPALEWARFEVLRKSARGAVVLENNGGAIRPRWDAKRGNPYLAGVQAIIPRDDGPPAEFDIPLTYFHTLARAASPQFVASGRLAEGEVFQYLVCAYRSTDQQAPADDQQDVSFSVQPVAETLAVDERPLDAYLADSDACGPSGGDQVPVFIPRQVLEEAVALMRATGAAETGGILIGHLHRDRAGRGLFLEVTAQIPAQHAEQELARLTFTPHTWVAVDAAISLRGRNELYVGWWHTHPSSHWCDECPPETRQRCKLSGKLPGGFFSAHDVALHRTVFPRAYSVALVVSGNCKSADGPAWRLFGWQCGMVVDRGFHVLGVAGPYPAAMPGSQGGEKTDVPTARTAIE